MGRREISRRGPLALALACCLLGGCPPRQPAVDLYLDAVALRELGQNELAVGKLTAVVAADPEFALAYAELGKAYQALGDGEKALAAFEQAAKLAPWSVEDHLNRARVRAALGRYPEAAQAYARAAELDPKCFDAIRGAAECYLRAGQGTKALIYCEMAEKAGDRPKEALSLLARAYEAQKDYPRALEVYERLLALDSDDPNVLVPLGVTYLKAGQYERARPVLVAAAQRRPQDGTVFRDLGYCLIKLGDLDQAVQMYEQSVALDAKDWQAQRGLGVVYMLQADRKGDDRLRIEALRCWRRSLLLNPDQPKREVLEKLMRERSRWQNTVEELDY